MKVIFYTVSLFVLIASITSCKSNDNSMRGFYKKLNSENRVESYLVETKTQTAGTKKQPKQAKTKKSDYSSEAAYMELVKAKSNEYKVKYDNADYTNSDIYVEAAKNRKAMAEKAKNATLAYENEAKTNTNLSEAEARKATGKKMFREEDVTFINKNNQTSLKKYSVIIATFAKDESVDRLKKTLADSNENVIFVRNQDGNQYAIVETFDSEAKAVEKLKSVQKKYTSRFSKSQLQKKYGIPFNDLWILSGL